MKNQQAEAHGTCRRCVIDNRRAEAHGTCRRCVMNNQQGAMTIKSMITLDCMLK